MRRPPAPPRLTQAQEDAQQELLDKITRGEFTLRLMYDQFANLMKMGPMGQVMSMIPGFSNALMPPGGEKESQARIKRFMTIMDSMTGVVRCGVCGACACG